MNIGFFLGFGRMAMSLDMVDDLPDRFKNGPDELVTPWGDGEVGLAAGVGTRTRERVEAGQPLMSTSDLAEESMFGYDPYSAEAIADPYPRYRWLRDHSPCHYVENRDVFVVTRFADARAIVRDPQLFSSAEGLGGHDAPSQHDLATTDPPEHGRLRQLVSRYFAPKEMAEIEDWTRGYVAELLAPALEAGDIDWVSAVARPLPTAVITHILGVPQADRAAFGEWADAVVRLIDGDVTGDARLVLERLRRRMQGLPT